MGLGLVTSHIKRRRVQWSGNYKYLMRISGDDTNIMEVLKWNPEGKMPRFRPEIYLRRIPSLNPRNSRINRKIGSCGECSNGGGDHSRKL